MKITLQGPGSGEAFLEYFERFWGHSRGDELRNCIKSFIFELPNNHAVGAS